MSTLAVAALGAFLLSVPSLAQSPQEQETEEPPRVGRCVFKYLEATTRQAAETRSWLVVDELKPYSRYVRIADDLGTEFVLHSYRSAAAAARSPNAGHQLTLTAEDELTGREWKYDQSPERRTVDYDPFRTDGSEIVISAPGKGEARLRCAAAAP